MFRDTARFSVQGAGLFLAIGSALFSGRLAWVRAMLSWRGAVTLGRWSYSLYLWHSIVLLCLVSMLPEAVWRPAVADGKLGLQWDLLYIPLVLAVSLIVAAMSYRIVEMPVVALRRRFGSHAIRDGDAHYSRMSSSPASAAAAAASTNGAPANLTGKSVRVKV